MKTKLVRVFAAMTLAMFAGGCVTSNAEVFGPNADRGAVVGGVLGAIIGNNSGNGDSLEGAAIGAVSGLILGSIVDNNQYHSSRYNNRDVIIVEDYHCTEPRPYSNWVPVIIEQRVYVHGGHWRTNRHYMWRDYHGRYYHRYHGRHYREYYHPDRYYRRSSVSIEYRRY